MTLPNTYSSIVTSSRQAHSRLGYSLIEMTVVATLSSFMLVIAVTVLIKIHKQEDHIGLRFRQTSDLTRLADQFRADVHAAETVEVPQNDGPASVIAVCRIPDGSRVEYRQAKQHLMRVTIDSQGEERQERFLISPEAVFALERITPAVAEGSPPEPLESERGQLVNLIVGWPMNGQKADAFRRLPIVAQIGRNLPVRLVKGEVSDAAP